jgi:outer membrane protein OmpA-like peptidoglycan-associated protein
MAQNDWLLNYAGRMTDRNRRLTLQHKEDERIKAEYRKILEIEGLLDLYKDRIGDKDEETERSLYPRNDYSGLNSLRARLNNKGWDGKAETMPKAMKKRLGKTDTEDWDLDNSNDDRIFDGNLAAIKNGSEPIGASIYFFFRLGTDELTEVSQLLNIDEIARVAKKHHLKVRISGAADSATGNERINNTLSQKRAEYIKTLMIQRGIEESLINTSYEGGIDEYSPVQANRQTCVTLTF